MQSKKLIVPIFVLLGVIISSISTIHSVEFFLISNGDWMAGFLAVAFEIGQIACLLAIMQAKEMNMKVVWMMFIFLTAFQIMSNVFHSFKYLGDDYKTWTEAFFLGGFSELSQKRIISFVLGGFLPLLSAGFTKVLVNYITKTEKVETSEESIKSKVDETEVEEKIKTIVSEYIEKLEPTIANSKEMQQELVQAYIAGRKETKETLLNKNILLNDSVDIKSFRVKDKDFPLRFSRCLDHEEKLKSFPVLNSLVISQNVKDLDRLEYYLQSNMMVSKMLQNALMKYEQTLSNANIR